MAKIGFIGLGNMGGPMAANLLGAGHSVSGFDLNDEAMARFVEAGGRRAGSLIELAGEAEVVVTMLPAGQHVRSIYLGEEGVIALARPETLLIDCSTIDVESSRAVAQKAEQAGLPMIDAPVSGGVGGAEAGTLTFMVGGSDAAFQQAKPILEAMGQTVVHAGGSGNGQAAKICNNMVLGISMIAVSEAFNLADKLGLDRQALFDISSKASGQCWSLTTYCPVPGPVPTSPANRGYAAGFTGAMMLKDLKLAQDAARVTGTVTPLGAAAQEIYSLLAAHGQSERDFSAVIEFLRGGADPEPTE